MRWLVGILLAGGAAQAFAQPEPSVVKVQSSYCTGNRGTFNGSGLLFADGGDAYVLTSEHVVLHAKQNVCHKALRNDHTTLKLTLQRVDFAFGLALLKVDQPFNTTGLPKLGELDWKSGGAQETVVAAGFPAASNVMLLDPDSRVLSPDSPRHLFPALTTATEMAGHGEFGMSGGPVLGSDNGRVVGVLSHQFLEVVAGGSSFVRQYGRDGTQVENHLLLIPAEIARTFVDDALGSAAGVTPFFLRDPETQYAGKDVIHAAGLRFEFVKGAGGGGGGGGGGIGGIDPIGIGGNDARGDERNEVKLMLSRIALPTQWFDDPSAAWVERVKRKLLGRDSLRIAFLARGNKRVPFGSLAKFFIAIEQGARPVVAVDPVLDPVGADLGDLMKAGVDITKRATAFEDHLTDDQDPAQARALVLLQDLGALGDLMATGDWGLVEIAGLRAKIADPAWDTLFAKAFQEALDLLTELKEAERILGRLNLERIDE